LLDVGRHERHPDALRRSSHVDFAQVVRDIVESYSPEAAFKPIAAQRCARRRLYERSLACLRVSSTASSPISSPNAIKFGAGAAIDVSLESKTGHSVQFEVQTVGIGICGG